MPTYRSIDAARENDPVWWYFAQTAETLQDLESQNTYEAIDRVHKTDWPATRASNVTRIIADNATGNTIAVVSYRQTVLHALTATLPAVKRKAKKKKAKTVKTSRVASKPRKSRKPTAPSRKKAKPRKK